MTNGDPPGGAPPGGGGRPVLTGRYEIEGKIGEGGMATVFRGRDQVLGRTVAIKVLSPRYAGDPTFVERFRREAQAAARLNHPNVVNVFDTGSDGNIHFIVMEYVQGRTLEDILRAEGRLQPERAVEIAENVAAALSFAHREGLVHRDIKPANVMITPTGEVKVMDFGIARASSTETLTQTATVLGTASYLSPEQAQGEPVDGRSDIYSLGVVLYEMLTGQVPFTGDTAVAVAYKHVREDPTLPTRIEPRIPQALEAVVMKALAKNPANRYQTSEEFRRDLERIRYGQAPAATPVLPVEQTAVFTEPARSTTVLPAQPIDEDERERRRWVPIVILTIFLVLALGAVAWFLISNILGEEEATTVTVPNVVGFQIEAAQGVIEDAGLLFEVEERNHAESPGIVFKQSPEAQTKVDTGATITLFVSRGPKQGEVPSLIGLTLEDARAAIEDAGFKVGQVDTEPSDEEPGTVIDQQPAAGTQLQAGEAIDLTVSEGPEQAAVPNLECLTLDEAQDALDARGLTMVVEEDQTRINSDCPDTEHVADQDPNAGDLVDQGTPVTVYVIETNPEPSPTASPTAEPT
jgi:serine/threonine-protein kinase